MAIVSDVEIRLRADIARLQQDLTAARRSVDTATAGIADAANRAKLALAGMTAGLGLRELVQMSDQYSKFTSQLKLATDSTREYAQAYADVKRIATDSQADLAATGTLYARISSSTKELGVSQSKVADITEATNLALKVSGATSEESASAILQLSQAFGAGALRGEEFNAVNEAAPRLMKAIADGLGLPVGALKNLASEGKITSQVLSQVLPAALGTLRTEAAQLQTISGAFTVLKNNVLEFVGTTSQASGAVATITGGIKLLSDNLTVLAGAALTVTAVKLANWLVGLTQNAIQSVTAARAMSAATLATAEANALAATQASLTANTYLVEARAATLAAAGSESLAFATNTLIPAQTRATVAAEAQSVAMAELAIAQRGASIAASTGSTVMAALGGPIGLVITALGLAATAWSVYQSKSEEANAKAAKDTAESTGEIVANIEKQNEKLRERIALSQQQGLGQIAQTDSPGTVRLAELLTQINTLKAQGAKLDAGSQVELITLQGIYDGLAKAIKTNIDEKATLAATGTAETDLVAIREKLTGVSKDYNVELTKLQTALEKGAITQETYISMVKTLAVETFKNSTAGKAFTDGIEAQANAIKRRAETQALLNSREQEHISFLKQSGQLDEDAAAHASAKADIKDLNQQIAAQQALLALAKKQDDRATIIGTIGNLRTKINNRNQKEEEDIFLIEQARYRLAVNNTADLIDAARSETKSQEDVTQGLQDEIAALGMTSKQIADVTAARIKDRAAALERKAEVGELQDVNDELRKQADELRKQADLGLTKERVQEQQKYWGDVDQIAHDTFVSIGDGGKDTFTRLKESAKNIFFDWLYQMTLKKWIISIGTATDGAAAVAGISGSSSALTSSSSILDAASKLYSTVTGGLTAAGGVGTGFVGSIVGGLNGAGSGAALSSSLGLSIGTTVANTLGPTLSSALATGISGLATALPWVGGAVAVYSLAKAAFGMGSKQYSDSSTLKGTLASGSFSGQLGTDYTQKGGWFRSDKHGTDYSAVDAATVKTLTTTYDALKTASSDYAKALGLDATSIANRTDAINVSLGKDADANAKAISDYFTGVSDSIASNLLPNIAQFEQAGETAGTTLARLASDFTAVDSILAAIGVTSQTAFGAVGAASIAARERLIALAGGLTNLATEVSYYNENFLTDAQKIAPIQKQVNDQLAAMGLAGITTTAQFADAVNNLVSSGALATESGAKQYATLLALAPQYKQVADYLAQAAAATADAAQAAKDAAEAAQKAADDAAQAVVDTLRSAAGDAFSALQRAVTAQKGALQDAFTKTMAGLDASIESVTTKVSDLQSLSDALKSTNLPGTTMDRATAQAQIAGALAIARAGGVLPKADDIKDALSALSGSVDGQFSSLVDQQRDALLTANNVEALSGLTDTQLSVAQQTLTVLNDQKTTLQNAYDAEVARLDSLVDSAQRQIDAINGVNLNVVSVISALSGLQSAIAAALGNATIAAGPSTSQASIETLYQSILGRGSDASGLQFWTNALKDGVSLSHIQDEFLTSPEYMASHPPMVTDPMQYGTMSKTSTDQAAINATMQTAMNRTADAVEMLSSQFNAVSGGGNTLLTTPA